MAAERTQEIEKKSGKASVLVSLGRAAIKLCVYMMIVALGSIVIELLGVVTGLWVYWFDEPGPLHSENMLRNELQNVEILGGYLKTVEDYLGLYDSKYLGVVDSIVVASMEYPSFAEYVYIARNTLLTVWAKAAVLVLMLPTYLIFGLVGLIRGLAARDLRRWEAGRELGSRYHTWLRVLPDLSFVLWATYLALPVTINPFVVIGPVVVLFGVTVFQLAYWTKKYA